MAATRESGTSPAPDSPSGADQQTGEARKWTWLARLRRPQGRKGELFSDILTDFPEKFAERKQLWLIAEAASLQAHSHKTAQPRQVTLINHWLHKGGIVLHFDGIHSIGEAEQLAGLVVAIPQEERAVLPDDEAYIGDLIGCTLIDVTCGEPITVGEIDDVDLSAGPVPLLVVRGTKPGRNEILIPFAKSYLRKIDTDARRIEMALPIGLVDLNEAESA
jgi:16S rRNA processing protein RimM